MAGVGHLLYPSLRYGRNGIAEGVEFIKAVEDMEVCTNRISTLDVSANMTGV